MNIYSTFTAIICCYEKCNVTFAITDQMELSLRDSHALFYCPKGHGQSFNGLSDAQKLEQSKAREVALNDQLRAAVRDADNARALRLRDQARFAKGVCPCCNRYFENVHRHMSTQHPDYVVPVKGHKPVRFLCSCDFEADTYQGLRIHQGKSRRTGWNKPTTSPWNAHLMGGAVR